MLDERVDFSKLGGYESLKSCSLLTILDVSLLLLSGCEGMPPTESNTPAVVPNPEPGAPIPGGLRIVSARATPLLHDSYFEKGSGECSFQRRSYQNRCMWTFRRNPPGRTLYTDVGMAKFLPGQTDVQVPIKVDVREPAQIPLKVIDSRCDSESFKPRHIMATKRVNRLRVDLTLRWALVDAGFMTANRQV